jgi:osmoprotectant transport system permease protein
VALPCGALSVHSSGRVFAADQPSNPWFSWQYVHDNSAELENALQQHITLTVEAVIIAMLIAFPLALLAFRFRWLATPVLGLTGVLYTIPSLALFAFLYPLTGLKQRGVVLALVIYALLVLVRNTLAGLDSVPADVREAAQGMGYGRGRMLWKVELPVALPTIMAGLRVATVSTVALTTVGVIVGNGGLGQLIFQGFNSNYRAEILTASLLTVALGLALDLLLAVATRLLMPWSRSRT